MDISSLVSNASGESSTATSSTTALNQNFDTFLTLLTTQLRTQDPLDPVNADEFTKQLVEFSSIEQQINSNQKLEDLIALTAFNQSTALVNYVGMHVESQGSAQSLKDGSATWTLNADQRANAIFTIYDENGRVVYEDSRSIPSGQQTFEWDGLSTTGQALPEGIYRLEIQATNTSGAAVNVTTGISGVVDEVDFSGGSVVLVIDDNRVPIGSVTSVREAGSS